MQHRQLLNIDSSGQQDCFRTDTVFPDAVRTAAAAPCWTTLHPTELACSLLSYWATLHCWATLHPSELRSTVLSYAAYATSYLLSYATSYWAKLYHTELRCSLTELSLHPTELRCTLLSYSVSYWAMLLPMELHCTLLSYAAPYWATLHPNFAFYDTHLKYFEKNTHFCLYPNFANFKAKVGWNGSKKPIL